MLHAYMYVGMIDLTAEKSHYEEVVVNLFIFLRVIDGDLLAILSALISPRLVQRRSGF